MAQKMHIRFNTHFEDSEKSQHYFDADDGFVTDYYSVTNQVLDSTELYYTDAQNKEHFVDKIFNPLHPDNNKDLILSYDNLYKDGEQIADQIYYVYQNVFISQPFNGFSVVGDISNPGNPKKAVEGVFVGVDKEKQILVFKKRKNYALYDFQGNTVTPQAGELIQSSKIFGGYIIGSAKQDGEYKQEVKETIIHNLNYLSVEKNGKLTDLLHLEKKQDSLIDTMDDLLAYADNIYLEGEIKQKILNLALMHPEKFSVPQLSAYLEKNCLEVKDTEALKKIYKVYHKLNQKNLDSVVKEKTGNSFYDKLIEHPGTNLEILAEFYYDRFMAETKINKIYDEPLSDLSNWFDDKANPVNETVLRQCYLLEKLVQNEPFYAADIDPQFYVWQMLYSKNPNPDLLEAFGMTSLHDIDYASKEKYESLLRQAGYSAFTGADFAYLLNTGRKEQADKLLEKGIHPITENGLKYSIIALCKAAQSEDKTVYDTALNLLNNLLKENGKDFNYIFDNMIGKKAPYKNAAYGMWAKGIVKSQPVYWLSTGYSNLKDDTTPLTQSYLAKAGILSTSPQNYADTRDIPDFCEINQTWKDSKGTLTSLLDYKLQNNDFDAVAKLLNRGANPMIDVERFSKKQNRNFPIKPFARFVDNALFLRKENNIKELFEKLACSLDTDKSQTLEQIFNSLSRNGKDNQLVRTLYDNASEKLKNRVKEDKNPEQRTGRTWDEIMEEDRKNKKEFEEKFFAKPDSDKMSLAEKIDNMDCNYNFDYRSLRVEHSYFKQDFKYSTEGIIELNKFLTLKAPEMEIKRQEGLKKCFNNYLESYNKLETKKAKKQQEKVSEVSFQEEIEPIAFFAEESFEEPENNSVPSEETIDEPELSLEERRRLIKEAKKQAANKSTEKSDNAEQTKAPHNAEQQPDLSLLANAFGGSAYLIETKSNGRK